MVFLTDMNNKENSLSSSKYISGNKLDNFWCGETSNNSKVCETQLPDQANFHSKMILIALLNELQVDIPLLSKKPLGARHNP